MIPVADVGARAYGQIDVEQGLTIETRVPQRDIVPAPAKVGEALQVPEGTPVLRLERLRLYQGEPIFLGITYLPSKLRGNLADEDSSQSLNAVLSRRCGLYPTRGKRIIESMVVGHRQAELSRAPIGAPLFRLFAVTYAQNDQPMEHTLASLRGDRIALEVNLKR